MQPGELIWFLVGIGTGVSVALLGFIAMAVVDGRRLRREAGPIDDAAEAGAEDDRDFLPDVPPEPVPTPRRRPAVAELRNTAVPGGTVDEMMSTLAAEIARMQSGDGAALTVDYAATSSVVATVAEPFEAVRAEPVPVAPVALPEPEPKLTPMRAAMAKAMAQPAVSLRRTPPGRMPPPKPAEPGASVPLPTPAVAAPEPAALPALPPEAAEAVPEALTFRSEQKAVTMPEPKPEAKSPPLPRVAPARKFAPALPPRGPNRPTPKPH